MTDRIWQVIATMKNADVYEKLLKSEIFSVIAAKNVGVETCCFPQISV